MFLTDIELRVLTGYQRPTLQRRWLERNGIPHYINAHGKPVVLSNWDAQPESQPVPYPQWFKDNETAWRFPIEKIRADKKPYVPGTLDCDSGIHFLFLGDDLQYIGLSGSVYERVDQHVFPFDSCSTISVPHDYMLDVETYYIHLLKPPLNIKYVILNDNVKRYLPA